MQIHKIIGFLDVNVYFLVNTQTLNAVIIDCGTDAQIVLDKAKQLGVCVKALLLTHAHYDHAGCGGYLQRLGVKVYTSKKDALKLQNADNLAHYFGVQFDKFTPDYTFEDGYVINEAGFSITAYVTPGHTDGSATFCVDNLLFTGDTLFNLSVGRTDFPSGSYIELKKSVNRLYNFNGDYVVYPGHGEQTTLSNERKFNPYFKL